MKEWITDSLIVVGVIIISGFWHMPKSSLFVKFLFMGLGVWPLMIGLGRIREEKK